MKVKITLLVIVHDIKIDYNHDDFFKILIIGDDDIFPNRHVGTCEIEETLNEIFNKYLNVQYGWKDVTLEDFRKISTNECEVLYSIKFPNITNIQKLGVFAPYRNQMELDDFYERILKKRRTIF
jgi:hypothetical protein